MISTKGRYAVRFMIDLAQQPTDKPITLDDVAQRQEISKKYMERVVKMLVSAGLVKGTSGKGGGYRLLRKPEEYNVMEILQVTEGRLTSVACLQEGAEECPREAQCLTLPMWKLFDEMVKDFFSNITIADLLKGQS
ncbi:Rrf2 family transcriptional regulator [uncultured Anaerovibrio sp.]|jgi:Rrf2 family protein|uniref:RrF2 family transcriptional regulator n=1 Tax=uncultured Anaerovibrio sp. TaxID=361586 RepID=UPI00261F05E4|nr:Rrf2 family transcriptional regulator [uncultured Anaerovibrio sp.]